MARSKEKKTIKKEVKTEEQLINEIIEESKKLALNKITSCYDLVMKTKELIKLQEISGQ